MSMVWKWRRTLKVSRALKRASNFYLCPAHSLQAPLPSRAVGRLWQARSLANMDTRAPSKPAVEEEKKAPPNWLLEHSRLRASITMATRWYFRLTWARPRTKFDRARHQAVIECMQLVEEKEECDFCGARACEKLQIRSDTRSTIEIQLALLIQCTCVNER